MGRKRHSITRKTLQTALLLLVLVAICLLFRTRKYSPAEKEIAPDRLLAVQVADGDTFVDSRNQTIRLLGIDTPERGEPFYEEARELLERLILGEELRYEYDLRKRDRYERLLAYVFSAEEFINSAMVRAGMAGVYIFPEDMKNLDYQTKLIEDQKAAREKRLGIWSVPEPEREQYYIGNRQALRFHRPFCQGVAGIKENNRIIKKSRDDFLDLGYSPCRNCNP